MLGNLLFTQHGSLIGDSGSQIVDVKKRSDHAFSIIVLTKGQTIHQRSKAVSFRSMKPFLPFLALLTLPVLAEPVWTDPAAAAKESPDFMIQGEYHQQGAACGIQVVALGGGKFEAYVLGGGLPGAGWEPGKSRERVEGGTTQDGIELIAPDSKTKILIKGGQLTLHSADKPAITLPRAARKSPTLDAKPPHGAVVLFDGSSADAWERGAMENRLLKATSCMSKQHFKSYTAHVEFLTPFKPEARGQKRGNSGIYHAGRWETQVLDSFGLEGAQNECGGIYSITKPRLNMCLPPLTWQTYDVDFTAATFDAEGKRSAWPRITVRLNGVVIHDNVELNKDNTASAPIHTPLTDAGGPMFLQDHGNPVYYRNIWVLPK